MEAVELPRGGLRFPIFMDRHAWESDGVILINRIKPHTDFHGRYESGLMKMAVIGLGKLEGARAIHDFGIYGLRELIGPGAGQVLSSGKILAGIGIVENAFHQTLHVEVLKADRIAHDEPRLLDLAKRHMPRLPTSDVDVLVVDRMGKDISGVGIDPNITGRIGVSGEHDAAAPQVRAMVACDLTEETHGNAIGVGLADVITRRLFAKMARFRSSPTPIATHSRSRFAAAAIWRTGASGSCASSTPCTLKRSMCPKQWLTKFRLMSGSTLSEPLLIYSMMQAA
jgi:hypothetical protein